MPAVLNERPPKTESPRALERQALQAVDDGQIVRSHLRGDAQAFGALVDRYQTRLLRFVYTMIRDRERAEDIVQEAFIRVHRNLQRYDPTKKFSTWIYTIASNLGKNELRNRRRSPICLFHTITANWQADHSPLQFEDAAARPDDVYQKRYLRETVERCVGQLPPATRAVFVLRELEGRSYAEISEIVGCRLGTVKSRLNRARHGFAQTIAPLLD